MRLKLPPYKHILTVYSLKKWSDSIRHEQITLNNIVRTSEFMAWINQPMLKDTYHKYSMNEPANEHMKLMAHASSDDTDETAYI